MVNVVIGIDETVSNWGANFGHSHLISPTLDTRVRTCPALLRHAVVKVRGNVGEHRFWAPKNCWWTFPGPTQPLMVHAGWEGPLQLTVGPKIFFRVPGPQIYTLTSGDIRHWQLENKNSSGDEIENVNVYAVRSEATRNIRWNNAITPFKVIKGHRFWYQSKAHVDLLLVINTNLPPICTVSDI